MKRDAVAEIEDYLAQAQSWELDRASRAERSAKLAWRVAGFNGLLALVAVVAVAGLTPLKRTDPYLVRVDNSTGVVDVVPMYEGTSEPSELVTRMLLNSYVIARERFFYGTAEVDYELVASMNTAPLNQAWAAHWDRNNPQSPLNAYKDGTTVTVQIRSISFLKLGSGKEMVQVRFTKLARPGGTGDEQATHWVSTIETAYGKPSDDEKLRSLNPLGFKVVEYQREPEVASREPAKGGKQ